MVYSKLHKYFVCSVERRKKNIHSIDCCIAWLFLFKCVCVCVFVESCHKRVRSLSLSPLFSENTKTPLCICWQSQYNEKHGSFVAQQNETFHKNIQNIVCLRTNKQQKKKNYTGEKEERMKNQLQLKVWSKSALYTSTHFPRRAHTGQAIRLFASEWKNKSYLFIFFLALFGQCGNKA